MNLDNPLVEGLLRQALDYLRGVKDAPPNMKVGRFVVELNTPAGSNYGTSLCLESPCRALDDPRPVELVAFIWRLPPP